jgi:hypothetical protein
MTIRTFQAGDEIAQVSIYNESAADLPKFKPATLDEVRRRLRDPDFDPSSRFFALSEGKPVGYSTFQTGRISFPWCRKGHEAFAEPLLEQTIAAMRQRGITRAFAAYRPDWIAQLSFLQSHGFTQTREMFNYVLDLVEMPTPAARASTGISPVTPDDLPAILKLGAGVLRTTDVASLHKALFNNPYFTPDSLFCLRNRTDHQPVAVGITVFREGYADPNQLDGMMPCFRLGAFGTEGLTHKRINGLFSLLAADTRDLTVFGLDLMAHASNRVSDVDVATFAAQAPSDAPHLVRFYKSLFRRQGGFPILERDISSQQAAVSSPP